MRVPGFPLVLCAAGLSAMAIAATEGPPARARAEQSQPADTAGVVAGMVVDGQGAPMPGAVVELLQHGSVVQRATTDARGEFKFQRVPEGLYEVRASRDGLVPATIRQAVTSLPSPALRLSLGVRAETAPLRVGGAITGGVPGGVVGGAVGGLPSVQPVPPPPPASPTAAQSVNESLWSAAGRSAPAPPFNTEAYGRIDDNHFHRVTDDPLSTFSVDVDTASYTNVRRFLNDGTLPPPDAVRVEELINYFRFAYPDATGDKPVSVTTEIAPCPWDSRHRLALVGLQARRQGARVPARNLVFLLDVSGSMMPPDKLPLVKAAMRMLVDTLTARDRVAIVVYAGASGLALPSTSADRRAEIQQAIAELRAGGSTNGAAGIRLAYDIAAANFARGGVNRVILATDGDFNVGVTSEGELVRLIEQERERGIFLSVLGVGTGNLKDAAMEKLADRGNGNYAYLDSLFEARRVLIEEAGATFETVAKDVKIQIEFNPRTVGAYRLIGYENRALNREDFNDDRKDAGDIGAGHTVTALYEIVPPGEPVPGGTIDPLIYQDRPKTAAAARGSDLMTVKLRYKKPDGDTSQLISVAVPDRSGELTSNVGFAAAVAQFGMLLRSSDFKGQSNWTSAQSLARKFRGQDPGGYRAEFIRLVDLAAALDALDDAAPGPRERTSTRR